MSEPMRRYRWWRSDGTPWWHALIRAWQTRGYALAPSLDPTKRPAMLELARIFDRGGSWFSRYGWRRLLARDLAEARHPQRWLVVGNIGNYLADTRYVKERRAMLRRMRNERGTGGQ